MARLLLPVPSTDFDPTESGVPWKVATEAGHEVVVATPDGQPAAADARMLEGTGLGMWRSVLVADKRGKAAYREMAASAAWAQPIPWAEIQTGAFDAVVLPGGHAPGMKPFLESEILRARIAEFFAEGKLVAAICHGVLAVARTKGPDGERSVLHGRRTTALLRRQEMFAWRVTKRRLGDYYRTYPTPVQDEVTAALADPADFLTGRFPLFRDNAKRLRRGFVVRDGNYLSGRWPGDAHAFSVAVCEALGGGGA